MEMVDLQCRLTPILPILNLLKIWISMSNNPRTMPPIVGFLSAQYIGESRIGAPDQAANIMISRSHLQSAPQTSPLCIISQIVICRESRESIGYRLDHLAHRGPTFSLAWSNISNTYGAFNSKDIIFLGFGWPFPLIPGFGSISGLGPFSPIGGFPGFGGIPCLGLFGPIAGYPGFGPSISPGLGPGFGSGVGPGAGLGLGLGPGLGPGFSPGVGPGFGPSVGPGVGPGAGSGYGPSIGPSVGPGIGPGVDPGAGPGMDPSVAPSIGPGVSPSVGPGFGIGGPYAHTNFKEIAGGKDVHRDVRNTYTGAAGKFP
nr:hypothetical protein CFP56_25399 [Quercus suber]